MIPDASIAAALRFPFQAVHRQWLLAFAAAGLAIAFVQSLLPGLVGALIALILSTIAWIILFRLASEILLSTSEGAPSTPFRHMDSPDGLAVKHIALWLLCTLFLAALAASFGPPAVAAGGLLVLLVLPAATLILTLDNSMIDALTPSLWLRLAARIGRADYTRLLGLLAGLTMAYLGAAWALESIDAFASLRSAVLMGYWAFAVMTWFSFAGHIVRSHRDELNLEASPESAERVDAGFSRDPDELLAEIREHGGTEAMHAELARQLDRDGEAERRLEHSRAHISALLFAFEKPQLALARAERMLSLDPDFTLARTDEMFALVKASAAGQLNWLTARLCRNYLQRFPTSVKCNEVRLTGCEALESDQSQNRPLAEQWYRRLMTAELRPEQRERLTALAAAYLQSGAGET